MGSNAAQLVGEEQPVSYHTAKAGLKQMARYYAVTLGRQGIRVNLVTPGILIKERSLLYFQENPELVRLYEEVTPLGRMGTPEDVIGAVKFLISPQAVFITGQDLAVDGGLSLLWQETLARKVAAMNTVSENKEFIKKG
jgi:NAD(P)-dependent dehydrogenase (short-subunit alcohol dehydrogenase family)